MLTHVLHKARIYLYVTGGNEHNQSLHHSQTGSQLTITLARTTHTAAVTAVRSYIAILSPVYTIQPVVKPVVKSV